MGSIVYISVCGGVRGTTTRDCIIKFLKIISLPIGEFSLHAKRHLHFNDGLQATGCFGSLCLPVFPTLNWLFTAAYKLPWEEAVYIGGECLAKDRCLINRTHIPLQLPARKMEESKLL